MGGVRCDVFELEAEALRGERPILKYRFWTDLPAGTIVGVSCSRRYLDLDGEESFWLMLQEGKVVVPRVVGDYGGGEGEIDIYSADTAGRREFDDLLGAFSSGISEPVGPEIYLSFTVGARQRLRAFGRNNQNLKGAMVTTSGGINCVEAEAQLSIPMAAALQPIDG